MLFNYSPTLQLNTKYKRTISNMRRRATVAERHCEEEPFEEMVPSSLSQAACVFMSSPTPAVIALGAAAVVTYRITYIKGTYDQDDLVVALFVFSFWLVQEWVVHKHLLHSPSDWFGRRLHVEHHDKPYYHISIDPLSLIVPAMILSLCLFITLMPTPLALTATASYYLCGLVYQYNHYIAHTRAMPMTSWGRASKKHHMLHHCRNQDYWLGFTAAPLIDSVFGTCPDPSRVPRSPGEVTPPCCK